MEIKKYPKPEVKNKRIDFFLTGLAFSLLVVFGAFSYTIYDDRPDQLENIIIEEDLVVMENTVQEKKPPPPPGSISEISPVASTIPLSIPILLFTPLKKPIW